ncbi:MAG TPA: signal peptidase I, partial [Acidothermaceae bacterium]|nr:signal peptidase I [Acidothermaceae bacterium]
MRKKSTKLTASAMLVGCFLALGWYFFAPSGLGGKTSYVVTHGVSMEPQFHTGDLAILRAAPEYRVGDVVGYRSATLGTIVMHRIVADDGGVFTFKGDNNSWTDPDHPTRADLIGRLALRVPHGGRYLASVDSTAGRVVAGGALALLLLGGAGQARRRRALRTSG